jgi:hypothetical protein
MRATDTDRRCPSAAAAAGLRRGRQPGGDEGRTVRLGKEGCPESGPILGSGPRLSPAARYPFAGLTERIRAALSHTPTLGWKLRALGHDGRFDGFVPWTVTRRCTTVSRMAGRPRGRGVGDGAAVRKPLVTRFNAASPPSHSASLIRSCQALKRLRAARV